MLERSQLKLAIEAVIKLYYILELVFLCQFFALLLLDTLVGRITLWSLNFGTSVRKMIASAKSLAEQLMLLRGPFQKLLLVGLF